jgi:putative chitinase
MLITPLQLKQVFPGCHDPNAWCRIFEQELPPFEITTPARVAAWVAQCGYESSSFNKLRETGSYTAKRLMEVWPKRFPTLADAKPYEYNPEGLLNMIYANELGNGPANSRDGTIYRGGGLIQITGRGNYREVAKGLGLNPNGTPKVNLEAMPKLIEQPSIACRTACYFWKIHDLNSAADEDNFEYITRKINGGMTGYADRLKAYTLAKALLKAPQIRKGPPPGPVNNIPKPQHTPGPQPGPVPVGTLDGLHTPGRKVA